MPAAVAPVRTLSTKELNRTLLQRQRLIRRAGQGQDAMLSLVEQLVGLQAQDTLPPYVGLWSRLERFSPDDLSAAILDRRLVRIVLMRGTIHLLTTTDCAVIRPLMAQMLIRAHRPTQFFKSSAHLEPDELVTAALDALRDGPVSAKDLGLAMARQLPDIRPADLANVARVRLPLVQLPPRGVWKCGGAVRYDLSQRWTGVAMGTASQTDQDELVRRYLRAFGPATAADLATWSGWTGAAAAYGHIERELVHYRGERGRDLVDLAGCTIADPEQPAPVRLLGTYDNVMLSHADRTRIMDRAAYQAWKSPNGGTSPFLLVDGFVAGLWRADQGRVRLTPTRRFTAAEQRAVDEEVDRLEGFLAL